MAQELLKVEHLSAAYGGIHALYDISLKVDAGEIVAVLGANGAGKAVSGRRGGHGHRARGPSDFL